MDYIIELIAAYMAHVLEKVIDFIKSLIMKRNRLGNKFNKSFILAVRNF